MDYRAPIVGDSWRIKGVRAWAALYRHVSAFRVEFDNDVAAPKVLDDPALWVSPISELFLPYTVTSIGVEGIHYDPTDPSNLLITLRLATGELRTLDLKERIDPSRTRNPYIVDSSVPICRAILWPFMSWIRNSFLTSLDWPRNSLVLMEPLHPMALFPSVMKLSSLVGHQGQLTVRECRERGVLHCRMETDSGTGVSSVALRTSSRTQDWVAYDPAFSPREEEEECAIVFQFPRE